MAHQERQERHGDDEDRKPAEGREAIPDARERTLHSRPPRLPLPVRGNPLVDADARRLGGVGSLREVDHQTFWIAARPRRPLGRTRMTVISTANT